MGGAKLARIALPANPRCSFCGERGRRDNPLRFRNDGEVGICADCVAETLALLERTLGREWHRDRASYQEFVERREGGSPGGAQAATPP